MRPKITTSRSIARSLTYNEQKVTLGKAECLKAANFLKETSALTPEDKLQYIKRRMELNDRVRTSLHITLNFDPLDKLSNEKMTAIADTYMRQIGFGRQPYVVYRHHDAGHPHCHIVTTHVRPGGDPINLYNIGRNQSEKARQSIEAEFQLTTKEMKQRLRQQQQRVDGVRVIRYGQASVAQSMARVLEHVTENYKYTSLDELNAALRLYNLKAYRGKENTQLYQRRGLLYRVLDENGQYIGVPLKASFFDCKPTLDNLEKQFRLNQVYKQENQQRLTGMIYWTFHCKPESFEDLDKRLRRHQISIVCRRDRQGNCREVFYVNHQNKCVFSGSELDERADHTAVQRVMERGLELQQKQAQEEVMGQRQRLRLRIG